MNQTLSYFNKKEGKPLFFILHYIGIRQNYE